MVKGNTNCYCNRSNPKSQWFNTDMLTSYTVTMLILKSSCVFGGGE